MGFGICEIKLAIGWLALLHVFHLPVEELILQQKACLVMVMEERESYSKFSPPSIMSGNIHGLEEVTSHSGRSLQSQG